MKKGPPFVNIPCCWPCCCFSRRVEQQPETEPSQLEQARSQEDHPRDEIPVKEETLPELPEKTVQRGRQELEDPRSPVSDDASVASTAINTALRFPSPARSETRPSLETLPEDDQRAAPPSYESVWNEKRRY
ncbi:uncharacterized protein MYCFIDRAFT_212208 [Pseudocercospora fijiensis CIRAD86]|uniref:Uncharacterized protein n=1 Tax=Pseudocercospora fijiensis (strain CIRAD86) TaxID=383855 RepID=M3APM9_PSEFD|nr:uncharacterized protein MYCFIDRAFT_212208 [Pseudocercospora fijiensis CIRAD86]EME79397.1 hypothetical protein MYCFIDRAFT_212208 [Pseudocercospora fijiensis CIRAD86]